MLYLRTGLPGASKTLNTLKEITSNSVFYDRPIYYSNIKLLFLDLDVCKSFSGWFYGVHYLNLVDSDKVKFDLILSDVHSSGRLAELSDFPYLEFLYDAWLSNHGYIDLFLFWVKRVYPAPRLKKLINYLDLVEEPDIEQIKNFYLDWRYFPDVTDWNSLPNGSVIVIDECQQWFPNRRVGSPVPAHCSAFETHRHKGYDVHLITQNAMLFDNHVRRLAGRHIHYQNLFGSKKVTRFEAEKVVDFTDYHQRKTATTSVITRDSKFYGLYYSADKHTHKMRIPAKLWLFLFLIVGVASLASLLFFGDILPQPPSLNSNSASNESDSASVRFVDNLNSNDGNDSLIPIQLHSSFTHPLASVCQSIEYSFSQTVFYERSVEHENAFYCVNENYTYEAGDSESLGQWVGSFDGFRLTSSYLSSLGYTLSVSNGVVTLSYSDLTFLLEPPRYF